MKKALLTIALLFAANAGATVDVQGQATIIVESYHEDAYYLRTVPTDFCLGIFAPTLAMAITKPVTIRANYGCGNSGDMIYNAQVNAATCAVVDAEESYQDDGLAAKITYDVSNCTQAKADGKIRQLAKALRGAIENTFKQNGVKILSLTEKK